MPPRSKFHKIIPEGEVNTARIVHRTVARGTPNKIHKVADQDKIPPGKYCCLYLNNELSVADTPIEHEIYLRFAKKANGAALVAGLGIGMCILPLVRNAGVSHVTVVEKSEEVIKLVFPSILKYLQRSGQQDKMVIFCDDIHTWQPQTPQRFDTIYFDIWPTTQNSDENERLQLKQQYFKYLVPEHVNRHRLIDYWKRFEKQITEVKRYGI